MGVIRLAAALLALATAAAVAQEAPPVFLAETSVSVLDAPDGARIGALPPGAQPVEASAVADGWVRIVFREGDGWVRRAALTPLEPRMTGGGLVPDGLVCSGTEPFWSLSVEGATARLSSPDAPPRRFDLIGAARADGRRFPLRISFSEDGAPAAEAVLAPALCTDSMSDRTYPWTVSLLPAVSGLRAGCCRLPRTTP
jgi:uncharacterized membrane protein